MKEEKTNGRETHKDVRWRDTQQICILDKCSEANLRIQEYSQYFGSKSHIMRVI